MPPYDCNSRRIRFSGRRIQPVCESGVLTDLRLEFLPNRHERLVEGDDRVDEFHMHEGWVLDKKWEHSYWVPVIYRAQTSMHLLK